MDKKFIMKTSLIMAGQQANSVELETAIQSLIDEVQQLQSHILRAVKKLIPKAISLADWTIGDPLKTLGRSITAIIVPRISDDLKDQEIFSKIVQKIFNSGEDEEHVPLHSGLTHEIKCQIRHRDREVVPSDVDKVGYK